MLCDHLKFLTHCPITVYGHIVKKSDQVTITCISHLLIMPVTILLPYLLNYATSRICNTELKYVIDHYLICLVLIKGPSYHPNCCIMRPPHYPPKYATMLLTILVNYPHDHLVKTEICHRSLLYLSNKMWSLHNIFLCVYYATSAWPPYLIFSYIMRQAFYPVRYAKCLIGLSYFIQSTIRRSNEKNSIQIELKLWIKQP